MAPLQTGGGYDAFQAETEGGVHAESFFDDNGEAPELLAFGPDGEGKGEAVRRVGDIQLCKEGGEIRAGVDVHL